jgi:uncharacterized membrane protein YccF (DUF307 family)
MIVFAKALIFVLCLNLACWMIAQSGVMPAVGLTPFGNVANKTEEIEQSVSQVPAKNPENLVTLVTGYVWFGLQFLWQLISWIVFGFPLFLSNLGLPTLVTVPLGALWFTLFGLFLVEFLAGRGT